MAFADTRTLLDRLTKKKALKILPKEKPNLYEALISMEQLWPARRCHDARISNPL